MSSGQRVSHRGIYSQMGARKYCISECLSLDSREYSKNNDMWSSYRWSNQNKHNYCDYDNQLNLKMDITIVIVTHFVLNSNPINVRCNKTNPALLSVTSNDTTIATWKPRLNIFNKQWIEWIEVIHFHVYLRFLLFDHFVFVREWINILCEIFLTMFELADVVVQLTFILKIYF